MIFFKITNFELTTYLHGPVFAKQLGPEIGKTFPTCYGNQTVITLFTRARYTSLSGDS